MFPNKLFANGLSRFFFANCHSDSFCLLFSRIYLAYMMSLWVCLYLGVLKVLLMPKSYIFFQLFRLHLYRVFSRKVPPKRSTLVPSKATRGAKNNQNRRFLTLQWCSAVVFKHYTIFSLFIRLQTCDTGHSKLPSLKNSTSHSNAGLSLVFHLPHSSSDHALLVVVDVISNFFDNRNCLLTTLTSGSFGWDQCT